MLPLGVRSREGPVAQLYRQDFTTWRGKRVQLPSFTKAILLLDVGSEEGPVAQLIVRSGSQYRIIRQLKPVRVFTFLEVQCISMDGSVDACLVACLPV